MLIPKSSGNNYGNIVSELLNDMLDNKTQEELLKIIEESKENYVIKC